MAEPGAQQHMHGVANYVGTAKLKIITPVRPALLPAPEAVPEPADGWPLLVCAARARDLKAGSQPGAGKIV